ncbi:hypothetical protein OJAV_G00220940 [Oryzias javanicus]|uniref:EGF-like domain-containing protein n=1 Tax=Oryzias javanicus TaxID=123683 RepID=A0A3S2P3P4_ORYJA|nr:hypothetical protein OJAV_G00220940 [Oryzias javanicus]
MLSVGPQQLRLLSCVAILLFFHAIVAKKDLKSACSTCRQITDNFNKGFDRTAKQNFGGGNTAWERGSFPNMRQVRFAWWRFWRSCVRNEELFETWWFKRKTKNPDLHKWFCIETLKVCCPKGTFGADCTACVGGSEKPCHGRGVCDGDGTRSGNGKCSCDHGYEGDLCLDCTNGFFSAERNDTFSLCSDVNECAKDPPPCKEDQYCLTLKAHFPAKRVTKRVLAALEPGPINAKLVLTGTETWRGRAQMSTSVLSLRRRAPKSTTSV